MKPAYRVISFAPNPLSSERVAFGAVVYDGAELRLAKARRLPGAECLGRRKSALLLRHLHDDLDSVSSWDCLPASFGPFVELGQPLELPAELGVDAVRWVEKFVLRSEDVVHHGTRGAQRRLSGYGRRFFETYQVAQYVRDRFTPSRDWGGWLGTAPQLQGITIRHWTADERELLLMEPLVPSHPKHDEHVKQLVLRMSAYRVAIDHAPKSDGSKHAKLCVFLLTGGGDRARHGLQKEFRDIADVVVDTDDRMQRRQFLEQVRHLGSEMMLH